MKLVFAIIGFWLLFGFLAWIYMSRQQRWQSQVRRYQLLDLEQGSQKRSQFWSQWFWYQNLQTFVSHEKLKQWQMGLVLALVIAPCLLYINGMSWLVSIPLTLLCVMSVVWFAYQQLQQKAQDKFRDELPDVIDGLIRALRVGAPMADVFCEMAEQHKGVTSRLFHVMYDELRVGQTLDEVMTNAAKRMPIAEFRFLTIVLSLQQETGGRLTEVLERLAATLRSRAELNASIQTITSESRNSAKILAALPILVCFVLFGTGREHFDFLMTTTGGQIAMVYIVTSILAGLFLIRRMTQLKG